jgi:hypothetical protein
MAGEVPASRRWLRPLFLVLAAVLLAIVAGSLIFNGLDMFRNFPAGRTWGLQTYTANTTPTYVYVGAVDGAAARAGLRVNDRLEAIGGEELRADATEFEIGRRLVAAKGDKLPVVVRSPGAGGSRAVTLGRQPHPWASPDIVRGIPLWLYAVGTYLSVELVPLLLVAAALLLHLRRPRDREASLFAIGFLLVANLASVDFWLLSLGILPARVFPIAVGLGECLILIAAAGFPGSRYDSTLSRAVVFAAPPAIAIRLVTLVWMPDLVVLGSLPSIAVAGGAVAAIFLRYRSLPPGEQRLQIKYVVLGFALTAVATAMIADLPDYGRGPLRTSIAYYTFYNLARLVAYIALPLGLMVSLLKYRLYSAEATISRSAAYAMLSVAVIAVFTASERVIEVLGEQVFGGNAGAIAGAMAAAIAAVMIAPMHHRIDHWAKHYFQKGLVHLESRMPDLLGDLREVSTPRQLAATCATRIVEGLHSRRVAISFDGTKLADVGEIDATPPSLVLPLELDRSGGIRALELWPRPDGSGYDKEEREVLADVADHLGRALEIAHRRGRSEAAQTGLIEDLAERVTAVEKQLAGRKRRAATA